MSESTLPKPFPESVIVVGAGVFGLSTALAISKRHPSTQVTVIDRLTPPVEDGTSVDTTRCIRSGKPRPARGADLEMTRANGRLRQTIRTPCTHDLLRKHNK